MAGERPSTGYDCDMVMHGLSLENRLLAVVTAAEYCVGTIAAEVEDVCHVVIVCHSVAPVPSAPPLQLAYRSAAPAGYDTY